MLCVITYGEAEDDDGDDDDNGRTNLIYMKIHVISASDRAISGRIRCCCCCTLERCFFSPLFFGTANSSGRRQFDSVLFRVVGCEGPRSLSLIVFSALTPHLHWKCRPDQSTAPPLHPRRKKGTKNTPPVHYRIFVPGGGCR